MGRGRRLIFGVMAAAIVFPLLLFAALQGAFLMQSARVRVETEALQRAATVNAVIDGLVSADQSALEVLASSQFLKVHDYVGARRRVEAVRAARARWRDVYLTDARSGRVIWDTAATAQAGATAPPWIGRRLASGGPSVARTMVLAGSGCPCVAVHAPVLEGGAVRYLLSATLSTAAFQAVLLGHTPPDAVSAVVDRDGRFIARSTDYQRRLGTFATRYVRQAAAGGRDGIYPGVTYEGFRNYTAFSTSELTGWSTHMAVSEQLLAGPRRASILLTVAAAAAAVGLAGILVWFAWRQLESRRVEEARLAQSDKLASIGELASGISHDFNNLLTVITTSAEFLKRGDLSESRRLRYVDAIGEASGRAAGLTSQLLAFARRQPLRPEVFDVGEQVTHAAELIRPMVGERVRLDLQLCTPPCYALADLDQFQSALLNLASNARDAMPSGGRMDVTVGAADHIPPTRGQPRRRGDFATVSVTDTGVGIAAPQLERIFEPFVTSKDAGRGTGLGLSQVLGFAHQSGGEITVESELGRGSTFRLYLPARGRPDRPPAAMPEVAPPEPPRQPLRILMVDDNVTVGQFSTEMLHDLGFKTTWVADAGEALGLLSGAAAHFDLVITDVVMPGMSGIDLAQQIRRRHPQIAVLLVSGFTGVEDQDDLAGLELLPKPYTVDALSAAIGRAMAGAPGQG